MGKLFSKKENFVKWYEDVIFYGDLASHGLVKGTILVHPKGQYIWEQIQKFIDIEFEKHGIENVLFPSLIPINEIEKEKKELSGFLPELFLVKKTSEINEKEKIFLRPTSEILFSYFFKNKLKEGKNLPVLTNQWCNVFREEKNTKFFLRGCEFSWQEAHTIHETSEEAHKYQEIFHDIYKKLITNFLQIAILEGEKTIHERFVGAEKTLTVEVVMPDGQCAQVSTSHFLEKNFSKLFDICYQDSKNQRQNPYQVSAGCSTRLIGALLMSHSDDSGLVLPWELSRIKIKILVINHAISKDDDIYNQINEQIGDYKYQWDFSDKSFGHKLMDEEMAGTPIVLVMGKKELEQNKILLKTRINEEKKLIDIVQIKELIEKEKKIFNQKLKQLSEKNLENSIVSSDHLNDVKQLISDKKIVLCPWFDDAENEKKFKEEKLGFGPRCIKNRIIDNLNIKCFFSGKQANCYAYFGRSY